MCHALKVATCYVAAGWATGPGAWPQGNSLVTPTGLMPQNWHVPISAVSMAVPGQTGANMNRGMVMKKL